MISLLYSTIFAVNDSVSGNDSSKNCESPTFEVTTKNITNKKTISINGVISIEKELLASFTNFIY